MINQTISHYKVIEKIGQGKAGRGFHRPSGYHQRP